MIQEIRDLVARASSVRVLVIGDVMLDEYIAGSANRISPEAPVPVVTVKRRSSVPGGAANVAANIASLGAFSILGGVIGDDAAGMRLRSDLRTGGIADTALVEDSSRVTTTKTRVTAAGQQIVRFDLEDICPLSEEVGHLLLDRCTAVLDSVDVVVISDYAKGAVDPDRCQRIIGASKIRNLPVVVDPKAADFTRYRGATVITPNAREAAAVACRSADILPSISPSALLVTRGEEGMSLFEPGVAELQIPAAVNEVADVTGAGDTVVGVLAIALGAGFTLPAAARIANFAAGIAVGHHGTWAVGASELLDTASRL